MSEPTFCWHCGKKLQMPFFAEVKDPLGNSHRVHKCCKEDAEREQKQYIKPCDEMGRGDSGNWN